MDERRGHDRLLTGDQQGSNKGIGDLDAGVAPHPFFYVGPQNEEAGPQTGRAQDKQTSPCATSLPRTGILSHIPARD